MKRSDTLTRLARTRTIQIIIAAISGVIAGLIVFSATKATGVSIFVITGAVSGVVAALVIQVYRRAAQLTEVKVTIPQFSELTFVVNNEARRVAWQLFIETVTRAATQALSEDQGLIREALTSLYGLFAVTRESLKNSRPSVPAPGSQTVEHMAVTMLNWELRPLLSKWHPRLLKFEKAYPDEPESAWEEAAACRADLQETQDRLRAYCLGFARLAGVRDPGQMVIQAEGGPTEGNPGSARSG